MENQEKKAKGQQPVQTFETLDVFPTAGNFPRRGGVDCSENEALNDYDRYAGDRVRWLRDNAHRICGIKDTEYCIMRRHHFGAAEFWDWLVADASVGNIKRVRFARVGWDEFMSVFGNDIANQRYDNYLTLVQDAVSRRVTFDVEPHTTAKTCYSFTLLRAIEEAFRTTGAAFWFAIGEYASLGDRKSKPISHQTVMFMLQKKSGTFQFFNLSQDPAFMFL